MFPRSLLAKGTLREVGAGVVGDMAQKAVKLSDRLTDGENPTIVIEFDTGYVALHDSYLKHNFNVAPHGLTNSSMYKLHAV